TQSLNCPILFLVQIHNGYQCINGINESIKRCARTRVWVGGGRDGLVVSGCNNLVLVVCRLENNRAKHRTSNQNKNRPEGRITVHEEGIKQPAPQSKQEANVAVARSVSLQSCKHSFC